jgi:Carboxypeptidase regulatory-like domain
MVRIASVRIRGLRNPGLRIPGLRIPGLRIPGVRRPVTLLFAALTYSALILVAHPAAAAVSPNAVLTVHGTVIDAVTQAPLAGVEVTAKPPGSGSARSAVTGADGTYAIQDLSAGEVTVKAFKDNYAVQWARGKTEPDEANRVYVGSKVDFALVPVTYGSLGGQLRRHSGGPIVGATVTLTNVRNAEWYSTTTDANGRYRFPKVEPRAYKVRFDLASGTQLWAHGKRDANDADSFTVTAANETTVDDVAPPLGKLVVRVVDAVTGEPLAGAGVYSGIGDVLFPYRLSDATGTVAYPDLPTGTYKAGAYPPDSRYLGTEESRSEKSHLVVKEDTTTQVRIGLKRATAIHVRAVDAATSAPVTDFCASYLAPGAHNVPTLGRCDLGSGDVVLAGMIPAGYKLFVDARDDVHGAQWVGAYGGTGDLDAARVFDARPGETVQVTVRLDKAGSITGVVRDRATHEPVPLCASVLPAPAGYGVSGAGVGCTGDDGRYTITGLGPYAWPVEFPDYGLPDSLPAHAWQWSGGGVNRHTATKVTVKAGGTATADADLRPAGFITGTAKAAGRETVLTQVTAVDTETDDYTGFRGAPDENGKYILAGVNDERVRVYFTSAAGGPDFNVRYPRTLTTHSGKSIQGVNFSSDH